MRRSFLFGLSLLILVGCGRAKAPLQPISTSVAQSINISNTPIPTSISPAATPLISSVNVLSNLHTESSTHADSIITVDAQAAIIILAQRSSADQLWYRVRVNDYQGWMQASLFNLSAQQQALLPWEQAVIVPSPTIQPTNRPYATQRPAVSRPRATTKPAAPSRPSSVKPPTTNKPRPRR